MTTNKDQAESLYKKAKDSNFYGEHVLNYLDSAIKLVPGDLKYFMGRGLAKMSKDLASAVLDFETAIALDPKYAPAYHMRGRVNFLNNQNEAAFVDFTKAIELHPRDYLYFENRGEVRFILNDYDGAIKDYTEAIQIIESDSSRLYNGTYSYIYRGKAKAALKDYDGAFDDFNKSIKIFETSKVYCERSNIKIEMGDFEGGYEDFVKAISLDENENVTIQFYERGFSKISAGELLKAFLYHYTEVWQWDIGRTTQMAIETLLARRANEYREVAQNEIALGHFLDAKRLLKQALHLMPEHYLWYNEIKTDIEKIDKRLKDEKKK